MGRLFSAILLAMSACLAEAAEPLKCESSGIEDPLCTLSEGGEPSKWISSEGIAQLRTIRKYKNTETILFSTLIFEYSFQTKCADAFVTVLTMKDKKLGSKKSHDFKSAGKDTNKLNFLIDGILFNYDPEKTLRVIYENGAEFGTIAPNLLLEKTVRSEKSIEVKIGNSPIFWVGKTTGINSALNSAKRACLSKI